MGIENNENKSFCSSCKGACCKSQSGINSPYDFGKTRKEIKAEIVRFIKSGFYAIDYWESESDNESVTYWVRPAHKNALGKIIDASCGGECRLLNENGCSLKFQERPYQCKTLIPKDYITRTSKKGGCFQPVSKENMRDIWAPFQKMMNSIIKGL